MPMVKHWCTEHSLYLCIYSVLNWPVLCWTDHFSILWLVSRQHAPFSHVLHVLIIDFFFLQANKYKFSWGHSKINQVLNGHDQNQFTRHAHMSVLLPRGMSQTFIFVSGSPVICFLQGFFFSSVFFFFWCVEGKSCAVRLMYNFWEYIFFIGIFAHNYF